MSKIEIDTELRETAKDTNAVSVKIIDVMKLIIKIKSKVEKNNLDKLFFELYLSDKQQSISEIVTKMEMDSKTLRRKRLIFCCIFNETRDIILKSQEQLLEHIFLS